MSAKTTAIIVIVVGVVIGLVALLADTLGLGAHVDAFGVRQIIGLVAGIVVVVIGGVLYMRAGKSAA